MFTKSFVFLEAWIKPVVTLLPLLLAVASYAPPASAQGANPNAVTKTYTLSVPKRSDAEVGGRGRSVASALLGQTVATEMFASMESRDGLRFSGDAASGLVLVYDELFDNLTLLNENVANDLTSTADIGESAARSHLADTFGGLVKAGVLDPTGLDVSSAQLQLHKQGIKLPGQDPREWVKEYVFFIPRELGGVGIRYQNLQAGVQVSVHRRGDVASVRILGPTVGPQNGPSVQAAITQDAARAKIAAGYPSHQVQALGLTYVLDDSSRMFHLRWTHSVYWQDQRNGREFHGRMQFVSPAVDNPQDVVVWPTPAPGATGDPR